MAPSPQESWTAMALVAVPMWPNEGQTAADQNYIAMARLSIYMCVYTCIYIYVYVIINIYIYE